MERFTQWLKAQNNTIKDSLLSDDPKCSSLTLPLNGSQVMIHQTSLPILSSSIAIGNNKWYRLDDKQENEFVQWQKDASSRTNAWKKLVDLLRSGDLDIPNVSQDETSSKSIVCLQRTELINSITQCMSNPEAASFVGAKLSLGVDVKNVTSLLTVMIQFIPLLAQSIRVTLVTNCQDACLVSYLLHRLAETGLPRRAFTHLIGKNDQLGASGDTALFVLTETGDIDSVYDRMIQCYLASHRKHIALFAHEELKPKVMKIFEFKQRLMPVSNKSAIADEKTKKTEGAGSNIAINLDGVDFEHIGQGITAFYYRTNDELVKLINHLQSTPKRAQTISFWSERLSLAYTIVRQFMQIRSVWINNFRLIDNFAIGELKSDEFHNSITTKELLASLKASDLGAKSSWSKVDNSKRFKLLNAILSSSKLPTRSLVRLGLNRSLNYEVEEYPSENILNLRYFAPTGRMVVQLGDGSSTSAVTHFFVFNALLAGNSVVLVGSADQLALWKDFASMEQNALQLVEAKSKGPSGVLKLIDDKEASPGLYIDMDSTQDDNISHNLARKLSLSICIALPESSMAKLVE